MNKEVFVNFYNLSFEKTAFIWDQILDFNSHDDLNEFLSWIDIELKLVNYDIDKSQALGRALIKDLLILKSKHIINEVLVNFFQYVVSISILRIVTSNKILNYSYDWICNSLSPDIPELTIERQYEPYRIVDFFASNNIFISKNVDVYFLTWSECLFYYSRCIGGHIELCNGFLRFYFVRLTDLFNKKIFEEELIPALTNISTWCYIHKKEEFVITTSEMLFKLYNSNISRESKKMIAVNFSCRKNSYNKFSKKEWCDVILKSYLDILHPHEHLQIYANKFENNLEEIIDNIDLLFLCFEEYHKYLKTENDNFSVHYELSRLYSNLLNLLNLLIQNGKTEIASEIICTYFRIKFDKKFIKEILFIVPNTHNGVLYSIKNSQIYNDTDTINNIPKIITLHNQFFSTTNTLHDQSDFKYENPNRFGVPIPEKANDFYNAVKGHFDFERLKYLPDIDKINGIHLFYGVQFPIQSVISRELKIILPIIQSFEKPNEQREIKKVLIWEGDTMLSQLECAGIISIFNKKGIETNLLSFQSSSKEEFVQNYNDDKYDLVWICSHGQYNHMEAHKSYLDLGNGIQLSLEELNSNELKTSNRRLIMVDACDGATTSLINSPLSIGIGSALVCSKQSLISHQWPIDNYSALISGILLATFLADGTEYSEALNKTINLFCDGKDLVINRIRNYSDENDIIERIENSRVDFKNFYSWGSLVYLI